MPPQTNLSRLTRSLQLLDFWVNRNIAPWLNANAKNVFFCFSGFLLFFLNRLCAAHKVIICNGFFAQAQFKKQKKTSKTKENNIWESPRTAVKHLMNWINRCSTLVVELKSKHYASTDKSFTPHQVAAIVGFLGEP